MLHGLNSLDFFDNSIEQIELIKLIRHILTETLKVICCHFSIYSSKACNYVWYYFFNNLIVIFLKMVIILHISVILLAAKFLSVG